LWDSPPNLFPLAASLPVRFGFLLLIHPASGSFFMNYGTK
jgi:hypothetical protein